MSVYSYIEVINPETDSCEDKEDKDLYMGFGHNIHWSYQIAVAGGKRIYRGVQHGSYPLEPQFEDVTTMSVYEQQTFQALLNYQTAIHACTSALQLKVPELEQWLRGDLEYLFTAQEWYQKAWLKLPNGIVRLDWCERVWGMDQKDLERWDLPNDNFATFVQLGKDCEAVTSGKLVIKEFAKKYQECSDRHAEAEKVDIEL